MSIPGYGTQPGQMSDLQMQQIQAMLNMAGSSMPGMAPPSQPSMPGADPNNMAQAYLTMLQYFAQQSMGMPPMPFPGMTPPYTPGTTGTDYTVSVSVEGMKFQYQLTEDDLHKVFGRYGGVKQIRVDEAGAKAQVSFVNFEDANSAMTDLNGKVLNGLEGTLRIQWVNQNQAAMPPFPPPMPGMPFGFPGMSLPSFPTPPTGFPPAAAGGAPFGTQASLSTADGGKGSNGGDGKGVRKYTCRFIIGIENDKEFQVSRRVIGAKGANMKRVVKNTDAKLRLRGMGSGYLEGAGKKESTEPLQLCISCTNAEHYKEAVRQVEDILKRVYEEYSQYCRENGKPDPDLQINCSENQLVYSAARSTSSPAKGALEDSPGDKKKDRRSRGKGSKSRSADDDCGEPGPNAPPVEEIEKVIDARNEARRACNYAEADRLRDALHAKGVALMDEPGGRGRGSEVTTWRYWRD